MRTKIAIVEQCLVDGKYFLVNQVFSFVSVSGEKNKVYKIKAYGRFYDIPGEYCAEIPDSLTLNPRTVFQLMEDTMDKTKDYQKAYEEILGHKKPEIYSAETGELITNEEPIETDGRQKNIPREGETDQD